ncbi:MaoC family dehydratase [Microvirga flavescens]|uniref:MaoC family dehydratase n=1 Tax=Microvirga flavescens TaxID=2249811 RepID=UPI000DDC1C4A|nr:MaoC family dehydratase [Microvirga flavescens]
MPRLHFEDFVPGTTQILGPVPISKDEIIAFASEYDPQPFHVDEIAAKDSFIGTLIASGWHTSAINMRLIADNVLNISTSMGSPGVEEQKWLKPVRPGDTLRSRMSVLESRASQSRPDLGLVRFQFEVLNQNDEVVLKQTVWVMFGRREPGPAAAKNEKAKPAPSVAEAPPQSPLTRVSDNPYLDDLVAGETRGLGSYTFTDEEIVRFATHYDPQPFHTDAEAAKSSLFGGLCASGWHTASVWMKLMAAERERVRAEALKRGERPARLGPSPGFSNLKWLKPVFAGDTITYTTTLTGKRASASRAGWGLAFHHNSGVNQKGEEVFAFDGTVFWEKRPT